MLESVVQRRNFMFNLIRNKHEMEAALTTTEYSESKPFAQQSKWMRWILALHRLDLPITTPIARQLLGFWSIKRNALISPGFKCLYGNIHCDQTVGLNDTFFVDYANIYIGRNTGFSFQNLVISSSHVPLNMTRVKAQEIIIGENVWITSRVIILPGVHIGHNSIIGAGSVVTNDIPPNTFAAGVPARAIRAITDIDRQSQKSTVSP